MPTPLLVVVAGHRLLPAAGLSLLYTLLMLATAQLSMAQGFSFSQQEAADKGAQAAESAQSADRVAWELATPCRADLKGKKIMVVIGEQQSNGFILAEQRNFGRHYQAINSRLRSLGMRTYTPEEIRAQVAQAEIDAYFRNDPDAALSAARRLGASFVLRGLITADARPNPMIRVNQVTVTMGFTLTGGDGRVISNVDERANSYAGSDVQGMALTLVNEKAEEVVARLYGDYCRNAGIGTAKAAGKKK